MKYILLLPLLVLTGCGPVKCPYSGTSSAEPTLQAAEDANTKEFTEESFK